MAERALTRAVFGAVVLAVSLLAASAVWAYSVATYGDPRPQVTTHSDSRWAGVNSPHAPTRISQLVRWQGLPAADKLARLDTIRDLAWRDPDKAARTSAVQVLTLGPVDPRFVPVLVEIVRDHPDLSARTFAAAGLYDQHGEPGVRAILELWLAWPQQDRDRAFEGLLFDYLTVDKHAALASEIALEYQAEHPDRVAELLAGPR